MTTVYSVNFKSQYHGEETRLFTSHRKAEAYVKERYPNFTPRTNIYNPKARTDCWDNDYIEAIVYIQKETVY